MGSLAVPVWTAVFLLFAANDAKHEAGAGWCDSCQRDEASCWGTFTRCRCVSLRMFPGSEQWAFIKALPLCFGWRSKQILLDYHTEHQPCSGPAVSVTLISSKRLTLIWPQYLCGRGCSGVQVSAGVGWLAELLLQQQDGALQKHVSDQTQVSQFLDGSFILRLQFFYWTTKTSTFHCTSHLHRPGPLQLLLQVVGPQEEWPMWLTQARLRVGSW